VDKTSKLSQGVVMKKMVLGARVVLGLLFLVFGINYFFPFLPNPPSPAEGQAFLGALFQTGYMFPLIKTFEVLGAVLVLFGFVPIGLLMLTPVVVNIFAFQLFLAPNQLALGALIVVLMAFLAWSYRSHFAPLFERASE
jgi:hypothetical protein